MKKFVSVVVLAVAAMSASAYEIGVTGGSNFGLDRNFGGVTLSTNVAKFGAEAGFERGTDGQQNTNTWTAIGSYSLGSSYGVGLALKSGLVYVDPEYTKNGWGARVGVGAAFPVAKNVTIGADYAYQFTESSIDKQSGNVISLNAKYRF